MNRHDESGKPAQPNVIEFTDEQLRTLATMLGAYDFLKKGFSADETEVWWKVSDALEAYYERNGIVD